MPFEADLFIVYLQNVTMRMLRPRMDAPVIRKAQQDLGLSREVLKSVISQRIKVTFIISTMMS